MEKFNFENNTDYAKYVLNQSNILLDKCGIYGSAEDRIGLMTNIKRSIEAKSWLMEIFKNSPYHNGKGQLILPMEIERPVDEDVIQDYANYIRDIAEQYLMPEARIDGYTYSSAIEEKYRIGRYITAVNYMNLKTNDVIIEGTHFSEYKKLHDKVDSIVDDFCFNYHCVRYEFYTEMENKYKYDKVMKLANAIRNCVGHLLENDEDIEVLSEAFPHSQCRKGIKISRCVQKCLKEIGLYQLAMEHEKEMFNRMYAKWTDAVSPMKIKKWSVLSINFVDYITMSHGDTWTTCLNTDKALKFTSGMWSSGFNSKRVLDYALDGSTMVFYTIDDKYDGDDFELQPKQTRQLFHFGEGKLVQARLYPQSNVSRRIIYDQYRANVEHLLANALNEANLWSAPVRGEIECNGSVVKVPYCWCSTGDFIDFLDIASHGYDENDFQEEVNYVVFKGSSSNEDNGIAMTVGSIEPVCIMCGKKFSQDAHNSIACCC